MSEIKSMSSAVIWKLCRFKVDNKGKPADLLPAAGKVCIKKQFMDVAKGGVFIW